MTDPLPGPDGELCPSYMGFRHRLQGSFEKALPAIADAGRAFDASFGRSYRDPLYRYLADDADILFVTMGSLASEASDTADILREEGIRAGVIGLRIFRPFPAEILAEAVSKARGIAVMEKAISYGYEGALATELKAALFSRNGHRPAIFNYITGLGGKDVKPRDLLQAGHDLLRGIESGTRQERPAWIGAGI